MSLDPFRTASAYLAGIILPFHGRWPTIHNGAFIAETAVVIGDVEIADGVGVWFNCVLRGDVNHIRVGARSNIQDGTIVHVSRKTHPTLIGADVTIGHKALIHACTLMDGSFVGMGATVMDGCVVEPGAMVAAGSLVTPGKRIAEGELWAGSPAKLVRRLDADERARWADTARHYVTLGQEYRRRQIADALARERPPEPQGGAD